jgi:aminopeptidase YwaD
VNAKADADALFKEVRGRLSLDNMVESIRFFNGLHRYTGTPQAERAADYIAGRMAEYGVETRLMRYDAYLSVPLRASLEVGGKAYRAIAAVYSGEAGRLEGELAYDRLGDVADIPWREVEERYAAMKGKIVLTRSGGGTFAKRARDAGALAVIQMQSSKEELIHHATIGSVWGTPTLSDADAFSFIPYVCVTKSSGEAMRAALERGGIKVVLDIEMDNDIKRSTMPVATIPGKSGKFVLVSAHYDSWYEGITDNAASDAILMELARVFKELEGRLERGLVFGWWSGHSDGRYAGSTWFCDDQWEVLSRDCVAHINIDLAGCKNADQIRARSALTEGGRFTAELIEKYTGRPAKPCIPMPRGADQSFWGADVAIAIMLKYEPLPENCDFQCPSGGVWWHTDQDTIDKLDTRILERDALFNAEMISRILNSQHLPVDIPAYIHQMEGFLRAIESGSGEEFALGAVFERLKKLDEAVMALLSSSYFGKRDTDDIMKRLAGELARLTFSYGSPYYHDLALDAKPFPFLQRAVGLSPENCPADRRLFIKTDFVRQRNRLVGQIDGLVARIDHQLLRWASEERGAVRRNAAE